MIPYILKAPPAIILILTIVIINKDETGVCEEPRVGLADQPIPAGPQGCHGHVTRA